MQIVSPYAWEMPLVNRHEEARMNIYEEAKHHLATLRTPPDFLERAQHKGRNVRQGAVQFVGTR